MSRPGAYIVMHDGTQYQIVESYESIVRNQSSKSSEYDMIELTDYTTNKKIALRYESIDVIRQGGY